MDTNSIFGLMDFLIIAAGLYIVYSWYLLMFKGEIKEGVLVSQGWASKCKDLDGYRKFIGLKLLALAIVSFLSGGVCLYSDYVKPVPVLPVSGSDRFILYCADLVHCTDEKGTEALLLFIRKLRD